MIVRYARHRRKGKEMSDKRKYIFKMVKASEFDDWLNERADEGYKMEFVRMITRKELMLAVVMQLVEE